MNETVTVYYRFHPLAGARATTLENRSHRGEPIVVVADSDGQRYRLPLWMTAPEQGGGRASSLVDIAFLALWDYLAG